MLNKLEAFSRQHGLTKPGDHIICALSGGADSVALTFALYLLKDKLGIRLSAAHFNHNLRGEESDKDEAFVREFCERYDIPLYTAEETVVPGKKGLEAAAREARYAFFRTLPGTIATAHTADDNAETVLLHMLRGTGLKGLGGIAPVNGSVIRPMLSITRREVEAFLEEWSLPHREDSSNHTDAFLRNRLRHHVMPLLKQENPALSENLSAMALRLRQDEACLSALAGQQQMDVASLRSMHPALRSRCLEAFLKECGIREPEASHIAQAEALVFTDKPSAFARFPGGITVGRNYDKLEIRQDADTPQPVVLPVPGTVLWGDCQITAAYGDGPDGLTVYPAGPITVRSRCPGDTIRLHPGSKSLKKLFIDRKIPAAKRSRIPVICDEKGILAVYGFGINHDREKEENRPVLIQIEEIT